jgi:hypothetical protein
MVSSFFGGSVAAVAAVGAVVLPELEVLGDVVEVVDEDGVPSPPLHETAMTPRTVAATTRRRPHLRSVLPSKRAEYAARTAVMRRARIATRRRS